MPIKKLSEAYYEHNGEYLAKCPGCGAEYIDDIHAYGSLISPCCPQYAMLRGVVPVEKKSKKPAILICEPRYAESAMAILNTKD